MSENKEKNPSNVEQVNAPAGFTTDVLLKMLLDQQKETTKAYEKLGEALLESRKPYVDPAVLEAKKLALEERKKQVALEFRRRKLTKQQCLHRRTNSDGSYADKLNIKWQQHSNGIILGVCGTCFSQFDARNPEDRKYLQLDGAAARNMGAARGVVAEGQNSYAV